MTIHKSKYKQKLLRLIYIFDITIADLIFQKMYLANALVNPQDLE